MRRALDGWLMRSLCTYCFTGLLIAAVASVNDADALGFFNAGPLAGASQPRKHTQFIPLGSFREALLGHIMDGRDERLAGDRTSSVVPIEGPLLESGRGVSPLQPFRLTAYAAFHHAAALLPPELRIGLHSTEAQRRTAARALLRLYSVLQDAADMRMGQDHNLVLTRKWMLVVPRAQPSWGGVSINSLGFAGFILAKGAAEATLRSEGPLAVLRSCVCGEHHCVSET